MSGLFSIPVNGLKEGRHTFDFEIDRKFFDLFEESEIREGNLNVVTDILKESSHIYIDIRISGTVSICCDRCLGMFDLPVECENRLLVRFGNGRDDSDPEMLIIPGDEYDLDLKQYY